MQIESITPLLAVAVSLVGSAFIVVTRRSPGVRDGCSIVTSIIKFLIVIHMIPAILAGDTLHYTLISFSSDDALSIAFRVDAMGLLFAVHAVVLWILITPYSIGYVRSLNEHSQTRYHLCIALVMSSAIGVSFAGNLFTLYLFYEMASLFVYPLVVHKGTKDSFIKGNKYVFYVFGWGKLFLIGCLLAYGLSGTMELNPKGVFPSTVDSFVLVLLFFTLLIGITKAVMVPLHAWLPPAMFGPTPVITIHHVGGCGVGAFALMRVVYYLYGLDTLQDLNLGLPLLIFASVTIIVSSIIAMNRDDLKARLIYSTIGQISYTLLGVALLTQAGLTGGQLQVFTHALGKITLFFCVGAIVVMTGKTKVSELNGIGKQMPFTMAAFAVGALSVVGFPPTAGFISKWYLVLGSIQAEQYIATAVLITSSILSACYLLPIVYVAFFRDLPPGEVAERREAPAMMLVPLILTAVGTVAFFFAPSVFIDMANMVWGEF